MRKRGAGKGHPIACVGVIASKAELRLARRMRTSPDFFEVRLDYLCHLRESEIAGLKRPLIITARSAEEGGAGKLRDAERRDLLLKFLSHASYVDIELRSVPRLRSVWAEARRQKVRRICSLHDSDGTPGLAALIKHLNRATALESDVFKLVTRADSIESLSTLLDFLRDHVSTVARCVMATGKFGPISRLLFPEFGSALVYAPLRKVLHDGQLTLNELQTLRDFYARR